MHSNTRHIQKWGTESDQDRINGFHDINFRERVMLAFDKCHVSGRN